MYCPDMEPAGNIGWFMNDVGQPINNAGYQYMILKIASEADAPGEKTYGYSDEAVTVQSGIADDGNYPKLICKYSYNDGTTTYFMSAGHDQGNSCSIGVNGAFIGDNCELKPWG